MVTLTGTFTRLDGTPATGTVRVTPSRSPIMDSAGRVVISGPQVFPLDQDGKLTVQIPASDDPDLGPPFTYWIDVNLTHASWKINKVWIPHGSATVDLSEIADYTPTPGVATRVVTIPADGEDGQVLVWDGVGFTWDYPPRGPEGPPGEVTTAALTTALAGKVTGTGMTLRHDTTVGTRVLLDHPGGSTMIYGDTGWREFELSPGVVGNSPNPAIRRIGDQITIQGRISLVDGPLSDNVIATLPPGFRTRVRGTTVVVGTVTSTLAGSSPRSIIARATINTLEGPADFSGVSTLNVSFVTNDPWPTTLPGTPA